MIYYYTRTRRINIIMYKREKERERTITHIKDTFTKKVAINQIDSKRFCETKKKKLFPYFYDHLSLMVS